MTKLVVILVAALAALTFSEATMSINGLKSKFRTRFNSGRSAGINGYSSAGYKSNSYGGQTDGHLAGTVNYGHGGSHHGRSNGHLDGSVNYGHGGGHHGLTGAHLDGSVNYGHGGGRHGHTGAHLDGSASFGHANKYNTYEPYAHGNQYNGLAGQSYQGHGIAGHSGSANANAAATATATAGAGGSSATSSAATTAGHGSYSPSGDFGNHRGGRYGYDDHAYGHGAVHAAGPPARPLPPVRPVASLDSFRAPAHGSLSGRFARPHLSGSGGAAASSAVSGVGSAAASTSSASAGHGAQAIGTATGAHMHSSHYPVSHEHVANAGTYTNSDNGRESSAYRRSTEHNQEHEDGHRDDNHYYKSDTYGKAEDENMHEAFNKNDEDIEQTPTVFRSKKSGENYVMDFNKARRETGSGVLAKDKHSSGFNKSSNRFIEDVDQKHNREGAGILENSNHVSSRNFNDADEEIYDSDGFGAPARLHARPNGGAGGAAAASSAAAGGLGGSAVSSAAAVSG